MSDRRGDEKRDERRGDDRRDDRRGDDRRDDRRAEPRRDEPRRDDRRTEEPRRDDRRTEEPRRDEPRRTEEPRRDEPRRDDRRPPMDVRPPPQQAAQTGGYKSMFKATDNRTCKVNEESTISEVAKTPMSGELLLHTNFVALEVSKTKQVYQYNVSFEFLENAEDLAGNQWKEELIAKYLDERFYSSNLPKDEQRKARQVCVAYAQTILSPTALPPAGEKCRDEMFLWDTVGRERICRKYRLTLSEPVLRQPFFEGTDRAEGDWLMIGRAHV